MSFGEVADLMEGLGCHDAPAQRGLAALLMRLPGREEEAVVLLRSLPEVEMEDGTVTVPDVLRPYMGGSVTLSPIGK